MEHVLINKNYFIIILFILLLKILLSFLTFGGGDLNNFSFFYSLQYNEYDIYSTKSPYPYLPFANFINILIGKIADITYLNFNSILKVNSIFFDFLIGYNLYLYFLEKTKNTNLSLKVFILYLLNPITIFITCFLGFTDAIIILILLYVCRLNDFNLQNNYLIPILLTISLSIKPVCIVFVPYFFFNSLNKKNFIILSFCTFFVINSFYFLNLENFENLVFLIKYIFLKMTYGHQVSYHGLGLLRQTTENFLYFQFLIKILKYLGIFFILLINFYLPKKIKSIEFVLLTFLIIFIFSDHVHVQYFLWIIPFLFLSNYNKYSFFMIINFALIILFFSIKWVEESNYGLIIFLEGLNTNSINSSLNKNIFSLFAPILILIYFFPLIIIFYKKFKILINEILISKFNFLRVFFSLFEKNNIRDRINFKNFSIFLLFLSLIFFLINYKDLFDNNKKIYNFNSNFNNIDKQNFKIPKSLLNNFYGETFVFETIINKKNIKNYNLSLNSNYIFSVQINDVKKSESLGYDYESDLGGESNLFLKDNIILDLSNYFDDSDTIKLSFVSKSLNPYNPAIIKYSRINFLNSLNWNVFYKNKNVAFEKKVQDDIIFISPKIPYKDKILSNNTIFLLIQILLIIIFIVTELVIFKNLIRKI